MNKEQQKELNELISEYWDLAYQEGKTGCNNADRANEILDHIKWLTDDINVPEITNDQ